MREFRIYSAECNFSILIGQPPKLKIRMDADFEQVTVTLFGSIYVFFIQIWAFFPKNSINCKGFSILRYRIFVAFHGLRAVPVTKFATSPINKQDFFTVTASRLLDKLCVICDYIKTNINGELRVFP